MNDPLETEIVELDYPAGLPAGLFGTMPQSGDETPPAAQETTSAVILDGEESSDVD